MPKITPTEIGYLDGVTSGIQTQINAITGGSGGTFTTLLTFTATGSATIGSSYADISGVTNQSIVFPATKSYAFLVISNGLYPSAVAADQLKLNIMIDNAQVAECPYIVFNTDASQSRRNDSGAASGSVTLGTRNVRIQAKALTGGRITVDSNCTFNVLIF